MTKASDNQFPKLIVQEAANDGSDFSNPAADYRVLFLGEDGQLHVKDSSGTVTSIGGGSTGIAATIVDAIGDIIVASAADTVVKGRGYVMLAETVLGGNQAAITFTGISGGYRDLIVSAVLRSAKSAVADDFRIRVGNGSLDTGTNYSYQILTSGNTTASAAVGSTQSTMYFGSGLASTGLANSFSFHEATIRNYASTSQHRQYHSTSIGNQNSTANQLQTIGGAWRNAAAAIDQVSVFADGGDLLTGSRVTLYGRG